MKNIVVILIKSFLLGGIMYFINYSYYYQPPLYEIPDTVYQHQKNVYILDAGHGNRKDKCGQYKSVKNEGKCFYEWQFNLAVIKKLEVLLNEKNIFYLRTDTLTHKRDLSVNKRVDIINKIAEVADTNFAPVLFSVHANASKNKEASGIELFVNLSKCDNLIENETCEEQIKIVANRLINSLEKNTQNTIREGKGDLSYKLSNMAKEGDIAILSKTKAYSFLIEAGFYTNPDERKKLEDPNYQFLIAYSIFEIICEIEAIKI